MLGLGSVGQGQAVDTNLTGCTSALDHPNFVRGHLPEVYSEVINFCDLERPGGMRLGGENYFM